MHLIFERSKGRFRSNSNILALAWIPFYNDSKFRETLFDYHQWQLSQIGSNLNGGTNRPHVALGLLAEIGSNNSRNLTGDNNHHANHTIPARDRNSPVAASSQNNGTDNNNSNNNNSESSTKQQQQPIVGQSSFLNARIAELYQRYVCLKGDHRNANVAALTDPNHNVAVANDLDRSYGRMSDFGWLAIGNVGRMLGVTLTSTVPPPREPVPVIESSFENGDLIKLYDDDDNHYEHRQPIAGGSRSSRKQPTQHLLKQILPPDTEYNRSRPDKASKRSNYNLRGHVDEVILIKWNELYQKLATIDSKGNVLIWCKIRDKFTIQTPFYNRSKSVADFKWSNDGKTALICYTDSFILVGTSSGQRHWHSMLNLDDYHITCASWTPNDEQLLLGVSNGNVVVIDLPHSELTELCMNQTHIRAMSWSSCEMSPRNLTKLCATSNSNYQGRPSSLSKNSTHFQSSGANGQSSSSSLSSSSSGRRRSTVVSHRRLSRDCSVFSRYRFCSQFPTNWSAGNSNSFNSESNQATDVANELTNSSQLSMPVNEENVQLKALNANPSSSMEQHSKNGLVSESDQRNILAIDFANNIIKLFDGGLNDPEPRTIHMNQESYIMHWSSDGQILAVAGFNIHTTAPSVGLLRCRYINKIRFFDQRGNLIHEHALKYSRYPITAFTWAHEDKRLFLATGPRLHSAKVFFGLPPLNLLAISSIQRYMKLADKLDVIATANKQFYNERAYAWQSGNCPVEIAQERANPLNRGSQKLVAKLSGSKPLESGSDTSTTPPPQSDGNKYNISNNQKLQQLELPIKMQAKIDQIFEPTIKQPLDELWSLNDIIWHVPKYERRYYCTLICYASEGEIGSLGHHLGKVETADKMADYHEHYRIFILYVEFEGSLIPILRARRVGFLKPEFVIFDPEDNQSKSRRLQKVSDISAQTYANDHGNIFGTRHTNRNQQQAANSQFQATSSIAQTTSSPSSFYYNDGFMENCSDLHQVYSQEATNSNSSLGRQSLSDAEHYYNFECDTVNRQNQSQIAAEIMSGRSHHQEPVVIPSNSCSSNSNNNSSLVYMMASSGLEHSVQLSETSRQSNHNGTKGITFHDTGGPYDMLPALNIRRPGETRSRKSNNTIQNTTTTSSSNSLSENNELVRVKSNIWGTKFKINNSGNHMIRQRASLGSVIYKTSILHLQPRQILLSMKDMSNYCCLCSRHHHSQMNPIKRSSEKRKNATYKEQCVNSHQSVNLIDSSPQQQSFPSGERKSRSRSRSSRSAANKRSDDSEKRKVVLQVCDALRVAPRLEANQHYSYAGDTPKFLDTRKLSASSSMQASETQRSSSSIMRRNEKRFLRTKEQCNDLEAHNRNSYHNHHRHRDQHRASSETHTKDASARSTKQRAVTQNSSSSSSFHSNSAISNHFLPLPNDSGGGDEDKDEDEEELLTLSLVSGDRMRVEMSSLKHLRNNDKQREEGHETTIEPHASGSRSCDDSFHKEAQNEPQIDEFLAANKTLKSIQTITKMIVDLSSKANNEEEIVDDVDSKDIADDLSSPSKIVKLSDESWSKQDFRRLSPPATPVHRPRRNVASCFRNEPQFQTQSANVTPLKKSLAQMRAVETSSSTTTDTQIRRYRSRKRESETGRRLANATVVSSGAPNTALPPPPPPVPIRRRLSSSAKRFIDGSLRSLYGGSGYTTSDTEDGEPLMIDNGIGTSSLRARALPNDVRQRLLGRCGRPNQPFEADASQLAAHSKATLTPSSRPTGNRDLDTLHKWLKRQEAKNEKRGKKKRASSAVHLNRYDNNYTENEHNSSSSSSSWLANLFSQPPLGSIYKGGSPHTSDESEGSLLEDSDDEDDDDHADSFIEGKKKPNQLAYSSSDFRQFNKHQSRGKNYDQGSRRGRSRERNVNKRRPICSNAGCCCSREFKLNNRPPVWNDATQVYQLDFGGRVTQESAKNLQIEFEGSLALQFGRLDRCTYTLDYSYPFNAVQAMSVALASLTQRLK